MKTNFAISQSYINPNTFFLGRLNKKKDQFLEKRELTEDEELFLLCELARKYIKKKSPVTAGLLSIIPGAGHFYCERRKDALVSFLLNGAMILGAFEAFENDMDAFGGIITFFELGFYSGKIYSAVSSAHKYNRDEKSNFLRYLKESTGVRISADKFGKNNPLFISCQFLF